MYRDHFYQCLSKTAECFTCSVYTKTKHFTDNYRSTEQRTVHPPMPLQTGRISFADGSTTFTPTDAGLEFKKATSECPYEDSRVTFIVFSAPNTIRNSAEGRFCKTVTHKRQALLNFRPGVDRFLVAWPGQYSQDIFEIKTVDERDKALTHFGLTTRPTQPTKTFTAADGTVYIESENSK